MVISVKLFNFAPNIPKRRGEESFRKMSVTELLKKSRNEGRLESLVSLVNDGDITLAKAASKMNLSVDDFCQTAERYGFVLL